MEQHAVRADGRRRVHLRDVQILRVWAVHVGPARPDEVVDPVLVLKHGPIDGPVIVWRADLANKLRGAVSILRLLLSQKGETYVERLGGVRRTRALEDVHSVVRIVPVIHGDVDVELAVDLVQLGRPDISQARAQVVYLYALRRPRAADVRRLRDADVPAGGVREVVDVVERDHPRVRGAAGNDR
jgi:hypothetical protein